MMKENTVIIGCSGCNTKNRIPRDRLGDRPKCGKCGNYLMIEGYSDSPADITDRSFEKEVLSFPGPVLVDCWAPWCGPCHMVAPILNELASEYAGRLKIAKLNVDENPETASRYDTRSIPTMLIFKGGKLVERIVGALPKEKIERYILSVIT
jgi:thioredoxin 2